MEREQIVVQFYILPQNSVGTSDEPLDYLCLFYLDFCQMVYPCSNLSPFSEVS
jgi:hypothetical protein